MRTPSESFEDFVLHKLNDDALNSVQHLKPQYFWIYKNNQQAIDYVGKTESMNKDMSKICSILNIPHLDLPHENKSSTDITLNTTMMKCVSLLPKNMQKI